MRRRRRRRRTTRGKRAGHWVGEWASAVRWDDVDAAGPRPARPGAARLARCPPGRVARTGAATAGGGLAARRRVRRRCVGSGRTTTVEAAAWLNATALVRLELDEGNKYAEGHPAAHGLPGRAGSGRRRSGSGADDDGRAPRRLRGGAPVRPRDPAAAGCPPARQLGGDRGRRRAAPGCSASTRRPVAAAIDTGAGMPVAAHFGTALDGNAVRDAWMGAANLSGLAAARMAAARASPATRHRGVRRSASVLGGVRPGRARRRARRAVGRRAAATSSGTRPARSPIRWPTRCWRCRSCRPLDDVDDVAVETHALAAGLARTTWDRRLSALFSTPFVVATALVHGHVRPASRRPRRAATTRSCRELAAAGRRSARRRT